MGIIKLNGTEYTSINVQDVLVGGISVVDPVTKVANVTVPTKTSDLTNDSGFIDSSALPTKVSDLTNDSGFITDNDLIPTDESAVDEFTTLNGGLLQECVVKLEPVQSGSGTPAPDNVRPISGHTEVDVLRVGKNHFDTSLLPINNFGITIEQTSDGGIRIHGTPTYSSGYQYFNVGGRATSLIGKTCTLSVDQKKVGIGWAVGTGELNLTMADTVNKKTDTITAINDNCKINISYNVGTIDETYYPQLELGSTATPYEPYKGHLYQVQIGSTVYGGSLDLVTGVMTVTHKFITYDGSADENWTQGNPNYRFLIALYDAEVGTDKLSCNYLEPAEYSVSNPDDIICIRDITSIGRAIDLRFNSSVTTLSNWKTYLSSNPLTVCYPLATPTTIQLTPQQISALIGENNLSTPLDGQSIDSVEYREVFGFDDVEKATSVKVPISLLGTDEFTSTASKAYSAGDYFYKDGMMCKALTSIAKGATLTLNTNYSASTLADILKILSQ